MLAKLIAYSYISVLTNQFRELITGFICILYKSYINSICVLCGTYMGSMCSYIGTLELYSGLAANSTGFLLRRKVIVCED